MKYKNIYISTKKGCITTTFKKQHKKEQFTTPENV